MLNHEILTEEQFINFSPEDGMGSGRVELLDVDPSKVFIDETSQKRHTPDSLARLQENIDQLGGVPIHPPAVRVLEDGTVAVIDGAARFMAAKNQGITSVQAVSHGEVDDKTASLMRLSANGIHTWGTIQECRELADLNRKGLKAREIARSYGEDKTTITTKVDIGYIPSSLLSRIEQDITSSEERAKFWSLRTLNKIAQLRLPIPGKVAHLEESLEGVYDYKLVQETVHEIVTGAISTPQELDLYIARLNNRLLKERMGELVHEETEKRATAAVEASTKILEVKKTREIESMQLAHTDKLAIAQSKITELSQANEVLRAANEALLKAVRKPEEEFENKKTKYEDAIRSLEEALASSQQAEANRKQAQEEYLEEARRKDREEIDALEEELREKSMRTSADTLARLERVYSEKERGLELKTEKTVRRDVAGVKGALSQVDQLVLGITSDSYLEGISRLQREEFDSFLAQIVSTQRILAEAEDKIRAVRQAEFTISDVASTTSTEVLNA
ncbi:ParB N-terminal domain-containing protein [Candidatus Roizmanbacteria bacterium]|nr:ParB N-terminal domain-containing protein [Candidatus Roizmanbacteria bacterium]